MMNSQITLGCSGLRTMLVVKAVGLDAEISRVVAQI